MPTNQTSWSSTAELRAKREGSSAPNPDEVMVFQKFLKKSIENKEKIKKETKKEKIKVLVLGATPELRDMAIDIGCETVAVDFTGSILKKMTEIMKNKNSEKNKQILGNWMDMESMFGPKTFDAVLSDASLNNISVKETPKLLKIIANMLKKDGVFINRQVFFAPKQNIRSFDEIIEEFNQGKNTNLGFLLEIGLQTELAKDAYNPETKQFPWRIIAEKMPEILNSTNSKVLPEKIPNVENQRMQALGVVHSLFSKAEFEAMLKEFFIIAERVELPQYPYTSYMPIYWMKKKCN